ncbi:MAG: hypothetical protein COS95_03810 [Ignavibacteriales bacterium CG07_land_8_20_14_0_80_59_12]|nr:MAG: hypothetical protein COS95_03810 [Ignavibacteriales bacterium CG07_land_8_20_14_0_80_59_12]
MKRRILIPLLIASAMAAGALHALPRKPASDRDSILFRAERILVEIRESYHRFSLGRNARDIILPDFLRDALELQAMIRDDRFETVRAIVTDEELVDLIYWQAMAVSDGDVRRGLLVMTLAVMDHWKLGLRLRPFGILRLPLTLESEDEFRVRASRLPRNLFGDTPSDAYGDRDKLQHFFGSAYLTEGPGGKTFADATGEFVEWGESAFVVGGVNDVRDVAANRRGQAFARALTANPDARPSDFLGGDLKQSP